MSAQLLPQFIIDLNIVKHSQFCNNTSQSDGRDSVPLND